MGLSVDSRCAVAARITSATDQNHSHRALNRSKPALDCSCMQNNCFKKEKGGWQMATCAEAPRVQCQGMQARQPRLFAVHIEVA